MILVDSVSGLPVGGLTITQQESSESHPSLCSPVAFANVSGTQKHYTVSPGNALVSCIGAPVAYNGLAPLPYGPGAITIVVTAAGG